MVRFDVRRRQHRPRGRARRPNNYDGQYYTGAVVVVGNQLAVLIGTGAVGGARQGTSVAISGDNTTIIDGGPYDNSNAGAAWIFTLSSPGSGVWRQQAPSWSAPAPLEPPAKVGQSRCPTTATPPSWAAIATTRAAARPGSSPAAAASGRSRRSWSAAAARPSRCPSATATSFIVGVNAGPRRQSVFVRSGGVWAQRSGGLAHGTSVALSADGNTAAVGGTIYARSGGVWTRLGAALVGSSSSVALSADGHTVLEGEEGDNAGAGAMWVRTRRHRRSPALSPAIRIVERRHQRHHHRRRVFGRDRCQLWRVGGNATSLWSSIPTPSPRPHPLTPPVSWTSR